MEINLQYMNEMQYNFHSSHDHKNIIVESYYLFLHLSSSLQFKNYVIKIQENDNILNCLCKNLLWAFYQHWSLNYMKVY